MSGIPLSTEMLPENLMEERKKSFVKFVTDVVNITKCEKGKIINGAKGIFKEPATTVDDDFLSEDEKVKATQVQEVEKVKRALDACVQEQGQN
jgi:hypothetical protein